MTEPQDPYQGQPYAGGYPYYPPPGYPAPPQYPPQYPQYPPQYQYPPPYPLGYPPYVSPHAGRPGTATASAVLAFVTAGLLILAALLLATGASTVNDLNNDQAFGSTDIAGELGIDAVFNLVAGGLLLTGGVQLVTRRRSAVTLICAGSVLTAGCAIYWLVRPDNVTPVIFWVLLFFALAAVTAGLALFSSSRAWLDARPG